jgi:antitoxin component YwqK of YwqJK toxin-antitoxin module
VPFTGKVNEGAWQGAFKNGKFEGPWVEYWPNGQLRSKDAYKLAIQEGPWVYYRGVGTKFEIRSGTYRNNVKVSD